MKAYEASSTIAADPDAIWAILTDAPAYPEWGSGVQLLEGQIAPGAKLKVTSEVNPKRAYPVKASSPAARWHGPAASRWG